MKRIDWDWVALLGILFGLGAQLILLLTFMQSVPAGEVHFIINTNVYHEMWFEAILVPMTVLCTGFAAVHWFVKKWRAIGH